MKELYNQFIDCLLSSSGVNREFYEIVKSNTVNSPSDCEYTLLLRLAFETCSNVEFLMTKLHRIKN